WGDELDPWADNGLVAYRSAYTFQEAHTLTFSLAFSNGSSAGYPRKTITVSINESAPANPYCGAINGIDVSPAAQTVPLSSGTQAFTADVDADETMLLPIELHWHSSNQSVATINTYSGIATLLAPGQTTICVYVDRAAAAPGCTQMTVTAPLELSS